MRQAFSFIIICIAACIVGISTAWTALDNNLRFNKVTLGQWEIWPLAGEVDADPYTKAYLAREGTVWMSVTEGLMLFARNDRENAALNGRCIYTLSGKIPRGRLWTLTTQAIPEENAGEEAELIDQKRDAQVHFITSSDTIWEENGQLIISVSQNVQPRNWLQVDGDGPFQLVLRIYDTPLTSGALDAAIVTPVITKGECS